MTLSVALDVVAAALGECAGAGRQRRCHFGVSSHPVGESILAVLDNGLGGLVAVVGGAGLTWGDWGVVNKLEKVLSVAGDDGKLLAVLAESIKLVGVGSL